MTPVDALFEHADLAGWSTLEILWKLDTCRTRAKNGKAKLRLAILEQAVIDKIWKKDGRDYGV